MDPSLRDLIEVIHFTENVSTKIHGLLDKAEIYRVVREEFARSKRYSASITLLTDDGSKLRVAETSLSPEELEAGERVTGLRLGEFEIDLAKSSIYRRVIEEGKTLHVSFHDIIKELFPSPLAYLISKTTGYEKKFSILTPLKKHGAIIGVFAMSSVEPAEYLIPSVRNLAQHLSTALQLADEYAERKRAERTLQESQERLKALFESAQEGILITGPQGEILSVNPAAAAMLGYKSPDELTGMPVIELYADPKQRKALFNELRKQGHVENYELTFKKKDGTTIHTLHNITIHTDEEGNLQRTEGFFTDITERKRTEEALRRQRDELATRARIVSTMLRTFDLDERLNLILDEILTLLNVELGGIYLLENNHVLLHAWRGFSDELRSQLTSFPRDDLPDWIGVQRVICEPLSECLHPPDFVRREGIQVWACVPLTLTERDQSQWFGAFVLASRRSDALTEDDVHTLEALSEQLALAIDHARRYRDARERLMRLTALHQIDRAIISQFSIRNILDVVLRNVPKELGADAIAISLFDETQPRPQVFTIRLPNGTFVEEEAFTLAESLQHWLVERKEPVIIQDLTRDPRMRLHRERIRSSHLVSYLGVPMVAQDRTIGILHLLTTQPRRFADEDVAFFRTLATQAAIAIENARLLEETRRRAAHMEALNEIIAAATTASDLQDLLQRTLDHALQALGLEEGAIWVHERLEASAPLHVERGLSSELGREIASMARAVGIDLVEPQIVTDWQAIADQRLPLRPIMARFGIRASLSVPLLAEDRFIGALNLASSEPRPWTDEEIALMKAVGQQVGAAAERLRLLERTRAHDDLASRLASLSDSLNRLLSVEDVIAAIGQGVLALSNADRVAVYLCTAKDTIKGAWIHGLSPTYPDRVAKLIRKIPGGRTLKDLKPVFVSDVMALPQTSPARHLAQMEGFRAFAVWPLVYEGRTIAGIGCYYDAPHTWLEAEKEIMETFARQAAVALENARLYTSLQEANTQLQKALQAKNEMIQNVSHELRTPLTMIRGYSELLREGLLGRLLPQQKEAVETLHRNAERLHFMVHRLLTFQTLDPRACEKTRISPAIWLEDAVSNWQSQAQEANIRLTLDLPPDLPPIQGAPDLLDQVMDNLLDNAIKFSPHGGDVTVRAWMNGEELTVAVSDQGIGIPPDKLEEIFERFYQIDGSSTRRFGGMGIGLALCKRIVESHSGRIWAESEGVEGRGSTFYVALPVREKASMETTSAS